jgi:hypothetical protein
VSFFSCGRWFQVWGKTEEKIYGPDAGTDYKDNQLRFSLLCQVRMPFYSTSEFRSSALVCSIRYAVCCMYCQWHCVGSLAYSREMHVLCRRHLKLLGS